MQADAVLAEGVEAVAMLLAAKNTNEQVLVQAFRALVRELRELAHIRTFHREEFSRQWEAQGMQTDGPSSHSSSSPFGTAQVNLITADHKALSERIVQAQGIENVISAMRGQANSTQIQTQACVVLRLLTTTDAHRQRAIKAGAVAAVCEAMRRLPGAAEMQQHCCSALIEICARAEGRRVVANSGIIDTLCKGARRFIDKQATIEQMLLLLVTLVDTPKAKVEAVGGGAVWTALDVMDQYQWTAQLQAIGCSLLKALTVIDDVRRLPTMAKRAVPAAVRAIDVHVCECEKGSVSSSVAEEACGALCNIMVDSDTNARAMIDDGGIQAVVRCMGLLVDNPDVQEAGCAALWAISAGPPPHKQCVIQLGGISAVVAAMAAYPEHVAIQVVGCAALRNTASISRNEVEVAAEGGIEVILDALRFHGANASVQEAGLEALAMVTRTQMPVQRWAFRAGAVEVIEAALQTRFPEHTVVRKAAQKALSRFMKVDDITRLCGVATPISAKDLNCYGGPPGVKGGSIIDDISC